jgi:hypothetical protein
VGRIVGIVAEHGIERRDGFRKAILLVIDRRQIGAGGAEPRREFDRPHQQLFGIAITADTPGDLGQHADRRDIGGVVAQASAQRGLGIGQPIFGEGERRRDHLGIVDRRANGVERGRLRLILASERAQRVRSKAVGGGRCRNNLDNRLRLRQRRRRLTRQQMPGVGERLIVRDGRQARAPQLLDRALAMARFSAS